MDLANNVYYINMKKLNSKELINEICELELITPSKLIYGCDSNRYGGKYTIGDYLNNKKLPRRMRIDLEKRWHIDNVNEINIVNKMRRKGQRFAFNIFKWLIIVSGIFYLLNLIY